MRRILTPIICSTMVLAVAALAAAADAPVETVEFNGESVGRALKYKIALPEGYTQSQDRYPVLYMLHGFSGNYNTWLQIGAPQAARPYGLILVFPDAGNSWYINWAASDGAQTNQWEDLIVRDLVGHVDANYRTIARREGRAICGLSMGGYGAVVLGLRHPEMFCSVASHSGALSYARNAAEQLAKGQSLRPEKEPAKEINLQIGIEGFASQFERTPQGEPFATADDCAKYDPGRLVLSVPREKLPHLFMNCGTEDPFLSHTLDFLKVLVEHKIPFTYSQSSGEHRKAFWRRELDEALAAQVAAIRRASRAASPDAAAAVGNPQ